MPVQEHKIFLIFPIIRNTVFVNITEMATKAQKRAAASAAGASYEIELPEMDGPFITRFPPEPSGKSSRSLFLQDLNTVVLAQ